MSPRWLSLSLLLAVACGPVRAKVDVEDSSTTLKSGFFNDTAGALLLQFASVDNWCDVTAGRDPFVNQDTWDLEVVAKPFATGSTEGDYASAPDSVAVLEPGTFNGELSFAEANGTTSWALLNGTLTIDAHETGTSLSGSLETKAWRDTDEDGSKSNVGEVSATFDLEYCDL